MKCCASFLAKTAISIIFLASTGFSQTKDVAGEVVEAQTGRPVKGALVSIKDLVKAKPSLQDVSDAAGRFAIKDVPTGVHTVITQDDRYLPASLENYNLRAEAPAAIKLQLYPLQYGVSDGRPFAKVEPAVAVQLLKSAKVAGDAQAIYLLSNTLSIDKPNDLPLKAAADSAREALAKQSANVSGIIVDNSGSPVLGATLKFSEVNTGLTVTTISPDGRYKVSLFPGTYAVAIDGKDNGGNSLKLDFGASTLKAKPNSVIDKSLAVNFDRSASN